MKRRRDCAGLLLLDSIVGLSILGMLLVVLASALSYHKHATSRMQVQRQLDRLAEDVLTQMQRGRQPAIEPWNLETEPAFTISQLSGPMPCDGWVWVEVQAGYEKQRTTLTGAVPANTLPPMGGTP